jgi:hypothetical protein
MMSRSKERERGKEGRIKCLQRKMMNASSFSQRRSTQRQELLECSGRQNERDILPKMMIEKEEGNISLSPLFFLF